MVKYVKCNNCKEKYMIVEELEKLGFPIGVEQCPKCGEKDYKILKTEKVWNFCNKGGKKQWKLKTLKRR